MRSKRLRKRGQAFTRAGDSGSEKKIQWGKIGYLCFLAGVGLKVLIWAYRALLFVDGAGFLETETFFVEARHAGAIASINCSINDSVMTGFPAVVVDRASGTNTNLTTATNGNSYYANERRIIETEGQLALLQKKVERDTKRVNLLRAEERRSRHLLEIKSITRAELRNLQRELESAEFSLAAQEVEQRQASRRLRSYRQHQGSLRSAYVSLQPDTRKSVLLVPKSGYVSAIYKDKGEVVTVGESILKIVNKRKNYIKAYFAGDAEHSVCEGDEAQVIFENGDTETGVIRKIYPTAYPQPIEIRHKFGKVQRFIIAEILPKNAQAWDRILETQVKVLLKKRWLKEIL